MLETLREHMEEFAADTAVRHVLPSAIMAVAGDLAQHLRWTSTGRPILSEKSVEALTTLAILAVNYVIHLWFFLKRRAAAAKKPA